jgi:hypothetical protein
MSKTIVKGVDLSGVEKVTNFKKQNENAKDVLELYDDKMRETQQSFLDKPPSTHQSSRKNMEDEARRSFYDGSGRYSQRTYDVVHQYLSQKQNYDTRKIDLLN